MRKRPKGNADVHNGFGEWGGYMDAKKSKLEEQFAADALKNPYKQSNLFAGISIFVNGLTNPSASELKRIMMTHGGVYHTYQKSSTTFIIASNLPDVKIRQITTAKIISPQWIVDCLEAKRIVDYSKYLLYTNCKVSQPKITFKKSEPDESKTSRFGSVEEIFNPPEKSVETGTTEIKQQLDTVTRECDMFEIKDDASTEPINLMLNLDILNTAIRFEKSQSPEDVAKTQPTKPIAQADKTMQEKEQEPRKGPARTAVDPNFLSEFYNNSRLHHIATLGASFKHHISNVREMHNGLFPARDDLKRRLALLDRPGGSEGDHGKAIMHIDMDCFFVSVGLRTRPHLKGNPIAVTHSKGNNANNIQSINETDRKKEMNLYMKRHEEKYKNDQLEDNEDHAKKASIDTTSSLAEIASCSYEARKMGVKNGMFVGAALKLCPKLKTIPYDFEAYKEVAHILYDTITQYTVDVEAVSCDEMYVNLTEVLRLLDCSAEEFVSLIRTEVIEKTQCPCSAGIGENRLQARMATKKAKPNGQFHLTREYVEEYFSQLSISELPGVGYSTTQKCNNLCLKTCADLQGMPLIRLQQEFGKKMGETLYEHCRGIDNKPLTYDQVRKSVSAEVNYGIRFTAEDELDNFLIRLCAEVESRLNEIAAKGKTITLKYMVRAQDAPVQTAKFMGHGFCDNVTKSVTLASYTCDLAVITKTVFSIKNVLNVPPQELRGIGIQISKLNTSQADGPKTNALKNMFEKAQAKQMLQQQTAARDNKSDSVRKSSIRKVKSFNGTPTRDQVKYDQINSRTKLHKIYEELDLNVLAELPPDIQQEILREKDSILSIDRRPEPAKKALARKLENDFQPPAKPSISEDNILSSSEWRHTISRWLDNSIEPVDCDVKTIVHFFKEFASAQKLCQVLLMLRYLRRRIAEMDCAWHHIYNRITAAVQTEVKHIFGQNFTLDIEDDVDCKKCLNKI